MLYDPEEANIFSFSEYISIAFYPAEGISPPDWDFEA
jgi:hypothetical protein